MPRFTFEYFLPGETPIVRETIDLPSPASIWCHVEALALRLGERPGAFIRVRDESGQAVVRAGAATARASIAQCLCGSCDVKKAALRGETTCLVNLTLSPCRINGACGCERLAA